MNPDPEAFDDERELDDPALEAVADAILEGAPIDWTAAKSGGSADPSLERQLRVLSDMAAVHRTLLAGEPAIGTENAAASDGNHRTWGHLRLLEKVGQGAFGEVFRAWDPHLSREVALKLLGPSGPSHGADSPSWVLEEARFLAAIRHPNVVTVYGADRIEGRVGFWTEFIHGRTLAELVHEQGAFKAAEAVAIGIDACRAISAVHRAGLLHRDIKANNVMREDSGRIVLLDFGATRDFVQHAVADAVIGDPNGPTGTPLYVAPELWRDSAATPQSDIYSLGVLLYFLVTGSYPVRGATVGDVGNAHRSGARVSLREERSDLPAEFLNVVERATDPDPSKRFESIDTFESALGRARAAMITPGSVPLWRNRRARVAAGVVLVLTGYAAFTAWQKRGAVSGHSATALNEAAPADARTSAPPDRTPLAAQQEAATNPAPSPSVGPAIRQAPRVIQPTSPINIPKFKMGHPSRDGRFLPYVGADGNVQVLEVATGQSHPVTRGATADESGADWLINPKGGRITTNSWSLEVMSPNGDRVAYTWALSNETYELRVVNANGSWERTLLERRGAYQPVPVDWSRDGKRIVCWLLEKDGTADLVLISLDDGSRQLLHHKVGSVPTTTISPDGRYVAFEQMSDREPGRVEVVVVSADGGEARPLFANARQNTPAWIDDTHLLFVQPSVEFEGSFDGWITRVVDGLAQGEPVPALPNLGAGRIAAAVTDNGLMYSLRPAIWNEVYTSSIDLAGQAGLGAPARISRTAMDHHLAPSWSPDGQSIAYLTGRPSQVLGLKDDLTLTIQDMRSSRDRPLKPALAHINGYSPQWLSDGQSVMIYGADQLKNERVGYYKVNIQTNETTAMMIGVTPMSRVLRDGTGVLYLENQDKNQDKRGIVEHTFAGGDDTVVVPLSARLSINQFGLSPDELTLAFVGTVTDSSGKADVLEVQARTGPGRELLRVNRPEFLRFQSWTPDGQHVLYTRGIGERLELWMLASSGGGEPRDMHLALPAVQPNPISLSPDGLNIAYPEEITGQQLWIRPLPPTRTKKE